MRHRILFLAAAFALAVTAPGHAQLRPEPGGVVYREDMPSVNAAPRAVVSGAADASAAAGFTRWYAAAGRPPILLFWNRQLIEDGASQYADVQTSAAIGAARADSVTVVGASASGVDRRGRSSQEGAVIGATSTSAGVAGVSEQRQFQERVTDSRYAVADPAYGNQVESGISSALLSASVRLVSREALIRKIGTSKSRDARLDVQQLESLALAQGVRYLVEVLPDPDPASPTGVAFMVRVTDLKSSTVRVQFVTRGEAPKGEARWVAVNGAGFEKRTQTIQDTPQAVGSRIAYEIMSRLR